MFRKTLYALSGALIALSIGAAGAYFTAQVQIPESIIRAGSVAISAEPTSSPLSIAALAPGTEVSRSLTVVNDGTMPVEAVISSSKKAGITAFWEALTCRATCDGKVLYDGPLSSMKTAPLAMGTQGRKEVRFLVGLPASAGNDLSKDYVKVSLYVDAEQAH